MQNNRIHINATGWVIAIGIFYSLIAISFVGFAHEHNHTTPNSPDCAACVFSANYLGIERPTVEITNLNTCISIHFPFDFTFTSTIPDNGIQSRAPPMFLV